MIGIIEGYLNDFIRLMIEEDIDIYNEFSLQHELGIFLRERFKETTYKIQFERNVSYFGIDKSKLVKKEIDITIVNSASDEKYALELKYPMNGQYPETMYSFIKDIRFCEQLTQLGFDGAFAFTIVNDKLFYEGTTVNGIYRYFRDSEPIVGSVIKPTGTAAGEIKLDREYEIRWNEINQISRYYIVRASKD